MNIANLQKILDRLKALLQAANRLQIRLRWLVRSVAVLTPGMSPDQKDSVFDLIDEDADAIEETADDLLDDIRNEDPLP